MWSHLLLISIVVSPSLGQSPVYYLLLVPAEVHYPSVEKACVDVVGAQEDLLVTITLQTVDRDTTLYQQRVSGAKLFHCVSFQVPPPADGQEEVASIHISLMGSSTHVSESKNILIRNVGSATVIQTDKHIYKPGQDVNFRILTVDRDFHAVEDTFPLVELQDPHGNRIGQWVNLIPRRGIIDLSYSLDSESPLGIYTIKSPGGRQSFHVAEYELPAFEVAILLPPAVTILDETIQFKICGRYTIGKPVRGTVYASLCRRVVKYYWYPDRRPKDLCITHRGRTNRTGCLDLEVMVASYQPRSYDYEMKFEAEASLEEDGTGIQINVTNSCRFTGTIAKVTIDELEISDSYYKPGLRYKGKIRLEGPDGSPMKSKSLYLKEEYNGAEKERTYETDEHGQACFTLDTKLWNGHPVILTASYMKEKPEYVYGELNPLYVDSQIVLRPFSEVTRSFLKIQPVERPLSCNQVHPIEIDYIIRGSELMGQQDHVELRYTVVAKGNLVLDGKLGINASRNSARTGTIELPLKVTADIAPQAYVLVYTILDNGRVSADTERLPVEKCFNNQVSLEFSRDEASPGSNVSLRLQASPGSLCAVRAVDDGVLFTRPEAEISGDAIYDLIAQRSRYGYPYRVQEEDPVCWKPHPKFFKRSLQNLRRRKRFFDMPQASPPDAFTLIKKLGLKILTNAIVKKPHECRLFQFSDLPVGDIFASPAISLVDEPKDFSYQVTVTLAEATKKIRRQFPETWLWSLVPIKSSGEAVLDITTPDSISEWKATMFCVGDEGLGLAPTASLVASQPFFITLSAPYSVVRGEEFSLRASVFNYLNDTVMIKATLKSSLELEVTPCPGCRYTRCLSPDEAQVFRWDVRAVQQGSVQVVVGAEAVDTEEVCAGQKAMVSDNGLSDTLTKMLIVKSEGMPVETSQNVMICTQGNLSSEIISISLPLDVVPGSAKAEMSVAGDLLGTALEGIEHLIDLPYGCGEQNMLRFAPNVYLMQYLERTNRLSESLRARAEGYMRHGYQRELNYKRADGSFSAFGDRDEDGNTWLSAFVLKIFYASSRYMFVEEKHLRDIAGWLKENQLPSGCFTGRGKLFTASLKGGVDDEISLSAYVTAALLEIQWPKEDEMMQNALRCLRSSLSQVDATYTQALLAYTFTLSGDYPIRDGLLKELHKKAVHKGGQIYWAVKPTIAANASSSSSSKPSSFEVELASYVTLAHLSGENQTNEDISYASQIVSWTSKQQNSHGGFTSIQDTVVALQAFCRYAELTSTGNVGVEVTVTGDHTFHQFWVDDSNKLLLQRKPLQNVPGNYTVLAKGEGCVHLQTALTYNVHPADTNPPFGIRLEPSADECQEPSASCFSLNVCAQYTGSRQVTDMIVIEVELLSGYSADAESVTQLEMRSLVKKIETNVDKVVIYVTELSHEVECFSLSFTQDIPVENLGSRLVKVYDYYEPVEALAAYNLPEQ
ncbi:alpha-2-macroglobulin-like protein 1 [Spea bombifrons]|uniref:alpha-2-macroglobulin-like protein 1 n=1 Tax=Spea bombifrons TaxID=233779 RepID=UPI0023499643|nr:alpha-2-macroglobulin-like protein 1 [Spea bombifrons]